ncbi:MAG: NADH-quinone oxidoreductase subunit J [Myxococcota bacterium]|nr:NADH-quinone oxidoreductase subunit J [Myxococcota bacterium]
MMLDVFVLYFCAGLALAAAFFLLVEARAPLSTSLGLVVLGLAVAGVMQAVAADYLALAEWILALGSALVFFVASLMVSGRGLEAFGPPEPLRVVAKLLGALAAAFLAVLLFWTLPSPPPIPTALPSAPAALGLALFGSGMTPLFLLGLLLLVAIIGSVVLGKRKLD